MFSTIFQLLSASIIVVSKEPVHRDEMMPYLGTVNYSANSISQQGNYIHGFR